MKHFHQICRTFRALRLNIYCSASQSSWLPSNWFMWRNAALGSTLILQGQSGRVSGWLLVSSSQPNTCWALKSCLLRYTTSASCSDHSTFNLFPLPSDTRMHHLTVPPSVLRRRAAEPLTLGRCLAWRPADTPLLLLDVKCRVGEGILFTQTFKKARVMRAYVWSRGLQCK